MNAHKTECFLRSILVINLFVIFLYFIWTFENLGKVTTNEVTEIVYIEDDIEQNEKEKENFDEDVFEVDPNNGKEENFKSQFEIGQWIDLDLISDLNDDSLIFIENSEKVVVSTLAFCCLESAAKHNPDKTVYFLRTTSSMTEWSQELNDVVKSYQNIKINRIDAEKLVLETPLVSLWNSERVTKSKFMVSHMSDVLRVATLYKYGGTYIDTDVITLKKHPDEKNYVNFEEPGSINGAILKFEMKHPVLDVICQKLAQYFNPRKFAANGPRLLSTALAGECGINPVEFAKATSLGPDGFCKGVRSFGPDAVFAVHYKIWKAFFQPAYYDLVMESITNSFATHVWGHFFRQDIQWARLHNRQPFYTIAKENCPVVFNSFTATLK